MKKILSIILAALLLCTSLGAVFCYADDDLSEAYYRAYDTCKDTELALSEVERDALDERCLDFASKMKLDIALLSVGDDYIDAPLEEFANDYYDSSEFGYGSSRSGFMIVYAYDRNEVVITEHANANDLIPDSYLQYIEEQAPGYRTDYGNYGVLYSAFKMIANDLNYDPSSEASKEQLTAADESTPRVVDKAKIFSEEDAAAMEARLAEIRKEIGKDIVIYTDISCYGKERKIAAADFFDDNGYGCGPDYEGVCLFICMDPKDRGWWCCCTGPDTMGLYTEDIANDIDDVLYDYMADGKYAEGVSDWIENIRRLYVKGAPFAPDWIPDRGENYVRIKSDSAPRVIDNAGVLSEAEIADVTARAKAISDKYGLDVVVNVSDTSFGMGRDEYQRKLYYYNGYGFGENYDGILATFFTRSGYCRLYTEGTGNTNLTETNLDRITSQCDCDNGKVYSSIVRFLEEYDQMRKTGRVPHRSSFWAAVSLVGALIGSVFGGAKTKKAKRRMKTVSFASEAFDYVVPGSVQCAKTADRYLNTTTSRRYDPVRESSSGGSSGGGGRSSYSSSYHSSSGRSHSGSGRSF